MAKLIPCFDLHVPAVASVVKSDDSERTERSASVETLVGGSNNSVANSDFAVHCEPRQPRVLKYSEPSSAARSNRVESSIASLQAGSPVPSESWSTTAQVNFLRNTHSVDDAFMLHIHYTPANAQSLARTPHVQNAFRLSLER